MPATVGGLGLVCTSVSMAALLSACGAGGGLKWEDANPSWSPSGHEIAFDSSAADPRHLLYALYVVNNAGTAIRKLTATDAELPQWSPDGSRLAYVGNLLQISRQNGAPEAVYSGNATIDEIKADGSRKRVLTSSGYTSGVEWSPNGRWLAFDSGECCREGSLKVVRPSGSGLRTLAKHVDFGSFSWSPDGTRLAFARSHYIVGGSEIYVVPAAAGGSTRLTAIPGSEVTSTSWSPDGRSIAFIEGDTSISGDALENGRAYVVDTRSGLLHAVSSPRAFPKYNDFTSGVAWLPRPRKRLLYNTDKGVFLTSTQGQGTRRINSLQGSPAVLSPDGDAFVFQVYTSSGHNPLYIQKLPGSARQLTQAAGGN